MFSQIIAPKSDCDKIRKAQELTKVSKNTQEIRATLLVQLMPVMIKVALAVTLTMAVAIGGGLFLDELFGLERRLFTFLLILISIPFTLWLLYQISMSAVNSISKQDEVKHTAKKMEDKTTE